MEKHKLTKEGMYTKEILIFFLVLAVNALALGFSDSIFSNYFKEVYNVDAIQRGFIEFPREIPGIICIFIVAGLGFLGDIRLSMFASLLSTIGILSLGLLTPTFSTMCIFLCINSIGMHLFFPLQDSIGMSLIKDKATIGEMVGKYKGLSTAFTTIASLFVFIGFKSGFFSFKTDIKTVFLVSGTLFIINFFLMEYLHKTVNLPVRKRINLSFKINPKYKFYYILAVMSGVQKQIMIVYGPWVLIELLEIDVGTISILISLGSLVGVFFIPLVGRWLDRYGIKKILYLDAVTYIFVYVLYGIMVALVVTEILPKSTIVILLIFVIFIGDKMSMQVGMVKSVYLRSIIEKPEDFTQNLTLGQSVDHLVSICCAPLGGLVWTFLGPQYVFFIAGALSLVNIYVAKVATIAELD